MGELVHTVLYKGHRIEVWRNCGNYFVWCDGNQFSVYRFLSVDNALREAYRKINYIESISDTAMKPSAN